MSTTYEQTSFDWQTRLLQQRLQEWWEFTVASLNPNLPSLDGISVPPLYIQILLWLGLAGVGIFLGLRLTRWGQSRPWGRWGWHQRITGIENVQTGDSWLEQAQIWHGQGNNTEAVRCLYFSLLEYLQIRRGISPLASRTDGEYRRLTQHFDFQESYDLFWRGHERICFRQETVSQEQWQTYWQAYQRVVND
ncbi:hypothetical protein GlitD10_0155 [Gloeomargarita lithophora Alchichica-D10]|uniref:Protein-glutamine gamma-glutamyltransferase-like C-terminal domain-containing protein n=1 Tax=Gloeomargarita lithophora Alchichica-D10 TaxID=1188229 RepID=A0A1J0A942_9CYAN|nr:DUF4129 domain-containing protein [Gloeomargarita lithophora]APB32456.1 hypothetical protein GlitD10_0155 [Gloeomargarita lithophora Alchichica-D10]